MSKPTKLPGLFALRSTDAALNAWAQGINELLEVRFGNRGGVDDTAVTKRELDAVLQRINKIDLDIKALKAKAGL